LGESFRIDPRYETLITMTPERRETVLQTSPVTRIAFGSYVAARDAARDLAKENPS